MSAPRAILTLLLALLATALPAQTTRLKGLEGANDALAWQAVGRLDAGDIGFCTATLIAPSFVLTAAHCVYAPHNNQLMRAEDLTFRAGLRNGSATAERSVSQIEAHPGYNPAAGVTLENVRYDVALLRLSDPIPTSALDPFIVADSTLSQGPVSVVSYGRGRAELPSRQAQCELLGAERGILTMNCDVTFGSSGAPVFTHVNGRGQIVSVISGIGTSGGKRVTFGMSLPPLVADLKHQMRVNLVKPVAEARRVTVGTERLSGGSDGAKFVRPGGP